jgi:hypothetical protein
MKGCLGDFALSDKEGRPFISAKHLFLFDGRRSDEPPLNFNALARVQHVAERLAVWPLPVGAGVAS